MPSVGQPGEQGAAIVERHREADIHEVGAAEIRVVNDVNVAFFRRQCAAFADEFD